MSSVHSGRWKTASCHYHNQLLQGCFTQIFTTQKFSAQTQGSKKALDQVKNHHHAAPTTNPSSEKKGAGSPVRLKRNLAPAHEILETTTNTPSPACAHTRTLRHTHSSNIIRVWAWNPKLPKYLPESDNLFRLCACQDRSRRKGRKSQWINSTQRGNGIPFLHRTRKFLSWHDCKSLWSWGGVQQI